MKNLIVEVVSRFLLAAVLAAVVSLAVLVLPVASVVAPRMGREQTFRYELREIAECVGLLFVYVLTGVVL